MVDNVEETPVKAPKGTPVFDADEAFGTVHGVNGVAYSQGGNWFDSNGTFVSKAK